MNKIKTSMTTEGLCPCWGAEIEVSGHYEYPCGEHGKAKLCAYSCPIVNNEMLPDDAKDKRYTEYGFCDQSDTCSLLRSFPLTVDVMCSQNKVAE